MASKGCFSLHLGSRCHKASVPVAHPDAPETDVRQDLYRKHYVPEAADVLRYGLLYHFNNALLINALKELENTRGGNLQDSNWNIDGCPIYNKEIEFYKNYDYS